MNQKGTVTRHFIQLFYKGYSEEKGVRKRDYENQKIPKDVFAFRYFSRDYFKFYENGKREIRESRNYKYSPFYYPGAELILRKNLKQSEDTTERLLYYHMVNHKTAKAIKARDGSISFFGKGDKILP